ncbi:MAG: TolC family protein [Myxococcaceae bacterium]
MTLTSSLLLIALLSQAPEASLPTGPVLTLEEAMRTAKDNSLELKQAQARLEQAWSLSQKAWSGYLPRIQVGANYTRNNVAAVVTLPSGYYIRDLGSPQGPPFDPGLEVSVDNPPGSPTPYVLAPSGFNTVEIQRLNQLGLQVEANQAVIAPALWATIHSAYIAQKAARLTVDNVRRETFFALAQLYYGAIGLKETVGVQERLLEIQDRREKDAQVRFQTGAITKVFLLRAQIDRARTEQDLRRARYSYASSKSALAALLAREPNFEVTAPPEPQALPESTQNLVEQAPSERPDVLAARANLELAESNHRSNWLRYFPSIGLFGRYQVQNVSGFAGRPDVWAVGVGLTWSIFDGGLREAELRDNAARIAEARAASEAAHNRSQDEVRRAQYDLESARANRVKASEQLKLAQENLQLVTLNNTVGTATYLDVSDATANLLQAELSVLSENLSAHLAVIKLARAAGRFDPFPIQP